MCKVTEDGDVTDVHLSVVSNLLRTKINVGVNLVFPDAPPGWRMTLSRDYDQFQFPPQGSQSHWVQASRLGLKFYTHYVPRAPPRSQVLCTAAEEQANGLTDFQVKLTVKPAEDPRIARASLVALPVTTAAISSLLSPELAREGHGYPCILLSEEPDMAVGPRPPAGSGHFGLPCLPVLWMSATATAPSPVDVLVSSLAVWGTATTPRLVAAEEFRQATSIDPVISALVPAEWRWPFQAATDSDDDANGE